MSFRPGSRIFSSFRPFFQRANARRHASTAGAEPAGFQKFWNSPIGPKTVHFWYAASTPPPSPPAMRCQLPALSEAHPHPQQQTPTSKTHHTTLHPSHRTNANTPTGPQ